MDKDIVGALKTLAEAQFALEAVVANVQADCKHAHVGECDGAPPMRICLDCGVTEKGWGIGFVVLTPPRVFKMDRDEVYRVRIGKCYDEDAKCEFKGYRQKAA
jgi:hypothetical protein